jgi:hypothetical protein
MLSGAQDKVDIAPHNFLAGHYRLCVAVDTPGFDGRVESKSHQRLPHATADVQNARCGMWQRRKRMAWMRGIESKGQLSTMIFHPCAHDSLQKAVDARIGGCGGKSTRLWTSAVQLCRALSRIHLTWGSLNICLATILASPILAVRFSKRPVGGNVRHSPSLDDVLIAYRGTERAGPRWFEAFVPGTLRNAPPGDNVVFFLIIGIAGQFVTLALVASYYGFLTAMLVAPVGGALAALTAGVLLSLKA